MSGFVELKKALEDFPKCPMPALQMTAKELLDHIINIVNWKLEFKECFAGLEQQLKDELAEYDEKIASSSYGWKILTDEERGRYRLISKLLGVEEEGNKK